VAADAVLFTAPHLVVFGIVVMGIKGALVDADLTADTPLRVSLY